MLSFDQDNEIFNIRSEIISKKQIEPFLPFQSDLTKYLVLKISGTVLKIP